MKNECADRSPTAELGAKPRNGVKVKRESCREDSRTPVADRSCGQTPVHPEPHVRFSFPEASGGFDGTPSTGTCTAWQYLTAGAIVGMLLGVGLGAWLVNI